MKLKPSTWMQDMEYQQNEKKKNKKYEKNNLKQIKSFR